MPSHSIGRGLVAGAHVGSYRVLSPLGAGGMGEVYRAHDPRLDRTVALKILPREFAHDPDRRARMLREARAVAALNHPNICTVHDVGEADGQIYIAMELIDGVALSARIAERPLPLQDVLALSRQLADGVAHAHDRGLVHRDLKAANVMVTPEGRVKVLDFGLAKRLSRDAPADGTTLATGPHTQPHAVLGTLPYMAPEQLRGEPADARSDVWALGVILHEMLSGSRPFGGRTGFEISSAIMHDAAAPLPEAVPAPLARVIERCLDKQPARRYQRAGELRAALEAVPADVAARPPALSFGWPPLSWLLVIGASLVVAAVSAVWLPGVRAPEPSAGGRARIQSLAVLPLENLSGDPGEEYFVTGIHEALITELARIGLQKVIAKPSADAFKGTNTTLSEIGGRLGVEGLVTGSVIRANGRIQITARLVAAESGAVLWANRYEGVAGDVLSLQNDVVGAIAREVRATLTPEQSARLAAPRPVNAAAHDAYLKGRSMLAAFNASNMNRQALDAAIREMERTIALDPRYAPPYVVLSLTYLTASQTSLLPPKETFPKARAAALKAVQLDPTLADAHAALAEAALWYDWDWDAADREIQRALQLNPDSTDALRASQTYLTLVPARFDEARRVSQRIVALDPLNPFSRVQPIWIAFYSRRHDESIQHAHVLRQIAPGNVMAPYFLAANYAIKQMPADVDAECAEVMKLLGDAYVMRPMAQCAWSYASVGQAGQARRLVQRLERPPAGVWLDPAAMSQVYAALRDVERAVAWLKRGLEERSPLMIYLKASAFWDPIRSDARFQTVLREMNFPR